MSNEFSDNEIGSSIIPPGYADVALRLSQLPQVSPYDCGIELDPLPMAGLNMLARQYGVTVSDIAKEAVYFYLRFKLMEQEP